MIKLSTSFVTNISRTINVVNIVVRTKVYLGLSSFFLCVLLLQEVKMTAQCCNAAVVQFVLRYVK